MSPRSARRTRRVRKL